MKKLVFVLGSSLAILMCTGCDISRISLDKKYVSIGMGDTVKLEAKVSGASKEVTWTSDDASIASVDENGVITPVSRGTTKITATANGKKAICDVKVRMKAILLGVDGAGDFFFDVNNPDPFKSLFENKHSAVTIEHGDLTSNPTISAECWGSMLCGVSPRIHGFTNDIIEVTPNTKHPSIFKEAYEQIPDVKLASFVNWTPINTGIVEDGIFVDKRTRKDDDEALTNVICSYLKDNSPDLLYVQFDSVDHVGHQHGYGKEEYLKQLQTVEEYIVKIHNTLKEVNKIQNYDFIVTADHGGLYKDHGGWSDDEKYTFFGITGSNIKDNSDIKDSRVIQGMNVIDNAAILAHCLGIENNPEWGKGIIGGIKIPDNIFID